MAGSQKPVTSDASPPGPSLPGHVKDRIRALARESGFAEKASVADFLGWRAKERADEADRRSKH